jgi:hypothetical protein
MAYLKINNIDFSNMVNALSVEKEHNYSSQTNAAGNTVVDYINSKRVIEVGIIPLESETAATLLNEIDKFNVSLSFLNPLTQLLEDGVNCIIPDNSVEYYTIQADKVRLNAIKLKFIEL